MFRWYILIERLFDLHKLCRGKISGVNRIHDMYFMPRRVVLRHHGTDGSDGRLCSKHLFSGRIIRVHKLRWGVLFKCVRCLELFKLLCRYLHANRIIYNQFWFMYYIGLIYLFT